MIEYKTQFTKIFQRIGQAENILIVCHKKPDGDCLGASRGLGEYLDGVGKNYTIFNVDKIPDTFNYLHKINTIVGDLDEIKNENFDLIILFDTGSLDYSGVGSFLNLARMKADLINIDHHISNTNYGDINLVIPYASSTSEIVYYFFKYNKIHIDKEMATCLLTGIVSDSGNFSNAATTIASIDAASRLLVCGGRLPKIVKKTYQNQSLSSLKLWGNVLSRLERNQEYDIAYTYITYEDLEKHKVSEDDVNGIANFLNNLKEGKAVILIKESRPGEISVSMRTTRDDVDLSALAKACGGGGHQKAAGFSLKGKLIEDNNMIRIE